MLKSDNILVRKSYFNSNIIARILQRFFLLIILKRTSTEAHVYMGRHQTVKVKHFFDVSNVIYHKFSHGPVSYNAQWGNRERHVKIFVKALLFQYLCHNGNKNPDFCLVCNMTLLVLKSTYTHYLRPV